MKKGKTKGNGAGEIVDPFDALTSAILGVASARSKAETMARVQHAQQLVGLIKNGLAQTAQRVGALQALLVAATKGEIREFRVTMPEDAKHARFVDQKGETLYVVDPSRRLVLVQPEHVEPIVVEVTLADDTVQRVEVGAPAPESLDASAGT